MPEQDKMNRPLLEQLSDIQAARLCRELRRELIQDVSGPGAIWPLIWALWS